MMFRRLAETRGGRDEMTGWTHKVVKMQRGTDGKWFAHSTAATFGSEAEARAYAERFVAEQRAAGVVGTRINVVARKVFVGDLGFSTNHVAEYRV